ncbi:hypothetical protein SLEP1_g49380 [Rubroshorea leprosula]|uniref:Uncharacterized protein n=1 Tax=Rubroshorea leprosula TaxID=152421 RepID=A0AAV5LXL1_9ROSI|nr:hypothetical protein SLEP1_g49380 [Rubroshorea leprosula]
MASTAPPFFLAQFPTIPFSLQSTAILFLKITGDFREPSPRATMTRAGE